MINDILKAFKKEYPKLKPKSVYELSDGYLIAAPQVPDGETDYGDPYYYVSTDLTIVQKMNPQRMNDMFKAFATGQIWTDEDTN